MAVSALAVLFSEEERPKAVGIWAAANMIAFPIGPILGGWLLSHYWWGWVFLMNVPVAALGFVAVACARARVDGARCARTIDVPGVVSSSAGLVGTTYGLIEAGQHGWGSLGALGPLVAGLALVVGFFFWERALARRPGGQPLVDLGLFRSPAFTWGVVLFAVLTLAMVGMLFIVPQYFQGVVGTSPEGSGIRLLPVVGGLLVGLLPARHLARKIGAKLTVATGFVVLGASFGLGATTTAACRGRVHRHLDGDRRRRRRLDDGDSGLGRPERAFRGAGPGSAPASCKRSRTPGRRSAPPSWAARSARPT